MRLLRSIALGVGVLTIGMLAALSAGAQSTSGLPGGATSLRETYGDWIVTCAVQQSRKTCAMQQELTTKQTGQRILAVELRPVGTAAEGIFMLPFGLALEKGAIVQIDDGAAAAPVAFRTCLPSGCVAPVNFDAKALAALRKGTALKVKVMPDGGGAETQWSVSLKGFGTALERTVSLLK
jgi:invasion protein IalB